MISDFGGIPLKTVNFYTENSVFMFDQKQVKELIARNKSEYDRDEITRLLELISTDSYKTILNLDDNTYFGYVVLDLISTVPNKATCNICGKIYDVC